MKYKNNKKVRVVLILFLLFSLIGVLIFRLPSINIECARLIINNPITSKIRNIHWSCLPSLIGILISFANVVYAIIGLYSMNKSKTSTPKHTIGYLIYIIISLGGLVIHCITFDYVFNCMIAG